MFLPWLTANSSMGPAAVLGVRWRSARRAAQAAGGTACRALVERLGRTVQRGQGRQEHAGEGPSTRQGGRPTFKRLDPRHKALLQAPPCPARLLLRLLGCLLLFRLVWRVPVGAVLSLEHLRAEGPGSGGLGRAAEGRAGLQ